MVEIKVADKVRHGNGKQEIEVAAVRLGKDVLIIIGGGQAHIGAVAMAIARPSLDDPERTSASASVITVTGHKEDELLRPVALRAASALNTRVVAVGGVHLDNATREDISKVLENCLAGVEVLLRKLKEGLPATCKGVSDRH